MQKQYAEQVKDFFQVYGVKRREWIMQIAEWKDGGSNKELAAKVEALMAQVEEYHVALNALLAQSEYDADRVDRLYRQMKSCYNELVQLTKPVWRVWLEAIVVAGLAAFVIRTFIFGIYHVPTGSAEPNILVGDRLWGNKMVYFMQKPKHGDLVIFNDPEFVYSQNAVQRLWQKYAGIPLLGGLLKGGPQNWVKRVVGVPGDKIEGRLEHGRTVIYRNGEKLDECYVNPYPLLALRKETGFFAPDSFLGAVLPSFLRTHVCEVRYTYDPSVPLDQQPYYHMLPQEVVRHPVSGEPFLLPAFEPTHDRMRRNVDAFGPFIVPAGKYWVQGDSRRNSRDSRFWMFLDEEHLLGRASIILFSLDSEEPFWLFALLKDPVGFFTHVIRWSRFFKPLWQIPDLREGRQAVEKASLEEN